MTTASERARDLAWAEAFAGGARVLSTLATRLRQLHEEDGSEEPTDTASTVVGPAPAGSRPRQIRATVASPPTRTRSPRGGFGPRQQQVLALGALDSGTGLSAGEVARALDLSAPNAHALLVRLEGLDALSRVPDEKPARWRRA